jgi:hypothetical protein
MSPRLAARYGATLVALSALAACSDPVTAPVTRTPVLSAPSFALAATYPTTSAIAGITPEIQTVTLCNAGPQTATFNATLAATVGGDVTIGTLHTPAAPTTFNLAAGQCTVIASKLNQPDDSPGLDNPVLVTVNMTSANFSSVSIAFTGGVSGCPALSGTTGAQARVCMNNYHGAIITYTTTTPTVGCTYTQGFWKTHGPSAKGNNTNEWDLTSITLGTVNYTAAQAQSIFNTPVGGNGLISLAHQLMAAKLNIANGASASPAVLAAITAADALIGSKVVPPIGNGFLDPSAVSSLVTTLTNFNEGNAGTPHCEDEILVLE